ncbi:MAG: M23 family metallopeptidase [Candidatus Nanopelagicales bacterium]|nr:M23 family metallopeptidase [Candidatus Nanopelagicales bacterium]
MKCLLSGRKPGVLAIVALVTAGLLQPSPAHAARQWDWPIKPARLSLGFDRPPQNWLPGHRGVDLFGRSGEQVLAAGNGVVTFAGLVAGKGVVVINHGMVRTTYEPVSASVTVGSRVRVGDVIGTLSPGESHCATKATVSCLHWGLIRGEKYLNPLSLVQKRVRLLPKRGTVFTRTQGIKPSTVFTCTHSLTLVTMLMHPRD